MGVKNGDKARLEAGVWVFVCVCARACKPDDFIKSPGPKCRLGLEGHGEVL